MGENGAHFERMPKPHNANTSRAIFMAAAHQRPAGAPLWVKMVLTSNVCPSHITPTPPVLFSWQRFATWPTARMDRHRDAISVRVLSGVGRDRQGGMTHGCRPRGPRLRCEPPQAPGRHGPRIRSTGGGAL